MNVGVLGHAPLATVDERGGLRSDDLVVDWWIGADDRWHFPAEDAATHQHRPFPAPVIETTLRVPGGEAGQRVYGATAGGGAVVVVEVENRSPAPFTAAMVVRVARREVVALDGAVLRVDGAAVLSLPRPPGAWAVGGSDAAVREVVVTGGARTDAFETGAGPIAVALLFPVAHRTTFRLALARTPVDVRALADADAVARGWDRQLERGMRAELPPPLDGTVDTARADLLLRTARSPDVVAALEDWGNDAEAAAAWARLGWVQRRRARRRRDPVDAWAEVRAIDPTIDPARFLSVLRSVLVRERPGGVDLLPGWPAEWLGQSVTVEAVPLRAGALSFAVRWHGARPAPLWDAPPGVEVRVPALDPTWSSTAAAGEALLAAPPPTLLPMGARDADAGERIDAPGQFS